MTDKKISELTSITGASVSDANDVLPIVDTSVATTKKITRAELFKSVSSVDINGGTIDGTVIGGSTPAAISGTTGTFSGNLAVDTNALFVGASTNRVGIRTSSPASTLTVSDGTDSGLTPFGGTDLFLNSSGDNYLQFGSGTSSSAAIYFGDSADGDVGGIIYAHASDAMSFRTNAAEHMRITSSGNVGIGTSSPSEKLDVTGNVTISGSLSKGSGSFKIDHPLKPDTHHLVHSFIEGPQADNIYRGKVALADGKATVNLDEAGRMTEGTFVALNGNVQCFTTNEDGWTAVRGKINGNILMIEAQDAACADTVSWLVIGERHDQHMIEANWTDDQGRIITEPEKEIA